MSVWLVYLYVLVGGDGGGHPAVQVVVHVMMVVVRIMVGLAVVIVEEFCTSVSARNTSVWFLPLSIIFQRVLVLVLVLV